MKDASVSSRDDESSALDFVIGFSPSAVAGHGTNDACRRLAGPDALLTYGLAVRRPLAGQGDRAAAGRPPPAGGRGTAARQAGAAHWPHARLGRRRLAAAPLPADRRLGVDALLRARAVPVERRRGCGSDRHPGRRYAAQRPGIWWRHAGPPDARAGPLRRAGREADGVAGARDRRRPLRRQHERGGTDGAGAARGIRRAGYAGSKTARGTRARMHVIPRSC